MKIPYWRVYSGVTDQRNFTNNPGGIWEMSLEAAIENRIERCQENISAMKDEILLLKSRLASAKRVKRGVAL